MISLPLVVHHHIPTAIEVGAFYTPETKPLWESKRESVGKYSDLALFTQYIVLTTPPRRSKPKTVRYRIYTKKTRRKRPRSEQPAERGQKAPQGKVDPRTDLGRSAKEVPPPLGTEGSRFFRHPPAAAMLPPPYSDSGCPSTCHCPLCLMRSVALLSRTGRVRKKCSRQYPGKFTRVPVSTREGRRERTRALLGRMEK